MHDYETMRRQLPSMVVVTSGLVTTTPPIGKRAVAINKLVEFGRIGGAVHLSRVCCSARMHEDDARWPTVHTTGALSDGTPPDFDAGIRWQADRKKGNAASAIQCLLVSFSPGMLAVMPQLHP